MKKINFSRSLLIFLLGSLSLGAFYGGLSLIIRPDGSLLKMSAEILADSPFRNFLIPGIILLLVFGIFPVYVMYGLIKKPNPGYLNKLNLLYDHHFAWTFAIYIGFGQVLWISIQTFILNSVGILHIIYSSLGLLLICVALLPSTRKHYRL